MDFPKLVTGPELLSIFEGFNTGEGGEDRVERVIREVAGSWELTRIPLDQIPFYGGSVEAPSSKKLIRRYSQMKTEAPPVILDMPADEYEIVDGFHRIAVARERGDKDILAYVPKGCTPKVETIIAAGDPELPVDKLRRVLPLVNAKMPPGMQLVAQAGGDLFAVDLVGNGVRSGSFTFFSTLGDMEWFTRLFGAVPFTPGSGMVYVTYRDDRSGVEEPAGLLNMGDADEVWAARLMTILGAPAAPPEAEPVIPQRDPPIINTKPQPIEKSFWFQQDGAQRLEQSIVYPKFKLPDSLWPVGWQPGDPVQAVTAKAKSYPESIMPTERNDFALDDAKRLGITRYEAKAIRADSFQAFQELLNAILVEQQLEEPYRKTVAGLLNRSRKAKGYEAL